MIKIGFIFILLGFGLTNLAKCAGLSSNNNFIVYAESKSQADNILELAEEYRTSISNEWLNKIIPNGIGISTISLGESDSFTWKKDHQNRKFHSIYLSVNDSMKHALKHEVVHAVFGTEFPIIKSGQKQENLFPIWIEEGIASRYDDKVKNLLKRDSIRWMLNTGNWPLPRRIFQVNHISINDIALYACCSENVDYLLTLSSKKILIEFGKDIPIMGLNQSLQKFYNIESYQDLFNLTVQRMKKKYSE